jgi:hypothetical protein
MALTEVHVVALFEVEVLSDVWRCRMVGRPVTGERMLPRL